MFAHEREAQTGTFTTGARTGGDATSEPLEYVLALLRRHTRTRVLHEYADISAGPLDTNTCDAACIPIGILDEIADDAFHSALVDGKDDILDAFLRLDRYV